jgi:hypothetical protein
MCLSLSTGAASAPRPDGGFSLTRAMWLDRGTPPEPAYGTNRTFGPAGTSPPEGRKLRPNSRYSWQGAPAH